MSLPFLPLTKFAFRGRDGTRRLDLVRMLARHVALGSILVVVPLLLILRAVRASRLVGAPRSEAPEPEQPAETKKPAEPKKPALPDDSD